MTGHKDDNSGYSLDGPPAPHPANQLCPRLRILSSWASRKVTQSPHLDSLGFCLTLSPLTSARHSPALTVLQTTRTSTAGAGALDPHSKLNTLLQHVREVNRLNPYCLQLLCCFIARCYGPGPILLAVVLLGMGRCYQTEGRLSLNTYLCMRDVTKTGISARYYLFSKMLLTHI